MCFITAGALAAGTLGATLASSAAASLPSLATASAVTSAVGAGVTAAGTLESGYATSAASNYAAEVAANNAIIAGYNAKNAEAAGNVAASNQSLKGAATAGAIKSGQAASGVDANTGSAVNVQTSQRGTGALDTETVLNNAELQAYGYRVQAQSDISQAELDRAQGQQAITGSEIGAAGSLLSGAASTGFKWSQATNPSTTGGNAASGVTGGQ
jgi:hypothetical protein